MQQNVLEQHPAAPVEVYAVWFEMVPGDRRSRWPRDLLTDPRVEHFWDEKKTVGVWYAQRTAAMRDRLTPESRWNDADVLWDAYLLYGADARWEKEPTQLLAWGRTIVAARASLAEAFDALFLDRGAGSRRSAPWILDPIIDRADRNVAVSPARPSSARGGTRRRGPFLSADCLTGDAGRGYAVEPRWEVV